MITCLEEHAKLCKFMQACNLHLSGDRDLLENATCEAELEDGLIAYNWKCSPSMIYYVHFSPETGFLFSFPP